MSHAAGSKEAAAHLIDPLFAPEPSALDGPGTHFGNTMAPVQPNAPSPLPSKPPRVSSKNPTTPPKGGATASTSARGRAASHASQSSPSYRVEAFGDPDQARRRTGSQGGTPPPYDEVVAGDQSRRHRRSSSLKERYPGDTSTEPLAMLRKDSKKAYRSHHLNKRSIPGTDTIDRLDPAIGGRAYHHEGPYDAAMQGRNSSRKYSPIAALETSNAEALKATPKENIRDAVERHVPLDGVATVPPGVPDRFGRRYHYKEGDDLNHEASSDDPGYKRWDGQDYAPDDLKGQSEPMYSLDRALKAHKIDDNGIEMQDRGEVHREYRDRERKGTLDQRDPVEIAGGESNYAAMTRANATDNDAGEGSSSGLRANLKKRIGSLKHRKHED